MGVSNSVLFYIELMKYSTDLSNTYENLRDRILSIQEEVESGDLDAYWLNHFELLLDLGWIS